MTKYERIPLSVYIMVNCDGSFKPLKIIFSDKTYDITKIIRKMKLTPPGVGCVAPIEYTVVIEGKEKQIYYEPSTNKWFPVKESMYRSQNSKQNIIIQHMF